MSSASQFGDALGIACRNLSVVIGSNKLVGLAFWVAVITALSALEAMAHRDESPVPSAGNLVARYLRRPVLRAGGIALWLYAGWHLFSH